jgi:hypothetical protein
MHGRITAIGFRGPHTDYHLETAGGPILLHLPGPPRHAAGEPLSWTLERAWVVNGPDPAADDLAQPSAMIAPE